AELREGDARERLRRVREDTEGGTSAGKAPQRRARPRVAAQERRGVILAEALEQRPPVPRSRTVESGSSGGAVRRQPVRIDGEDRVRGLEPRAPERSRVTDRVEVDGQCRRPAHARRRAWATFQSTIPHASPTESIATSTGEPWRPATNVWWNSSLTA